MQRGDGTKRGIFKAFLFVRPTEQMLFVKISFFFFIVVYAPVAYGTLDFPFSGNNKTDGGLSTDGHIPLPLSIPFPLF